jgi:type II restriction enzyme
MLLNFDLNKLNNYNSESQKVRVLTENWVANNIFCPSCGDKIFEYENNRPVADFYCNSCKEDYELKSKNTKTLGSTIADGQYNIMINKITNNTNPHFFFLNYEKKNYEIINFLAVPKYLFMPDMIIPRNKGLKNRPNYIMCNMNISTIPDSGKIFFIKDKKFEEKSKIINNWNKTKFLRNTKLEQKGWLIDIIFCIEKMKKQNFTLQELYTFVPYLKTKYPNNNFIEDKIRQQLQILRDKNYLSFEARGKYKIKA